MFAPLTVLLLVVLAASALYGAWLTARGRAIDNPLFYLLVASEVVLLVQLVVGIVRVDDANSHMSHGIFIAYLAGMVLVLPVAGFWAVAERRSRWGTGVLLVALAGLLVMVVRLLQLWAGHA